MTHDIYEFALPLPITQGARQIAQGFANQQPTPTKAEQVRLNTLAVLVTQDYMQLMDIPTNLSAGDSWNPVMRTCTDVADLELPGVGRLECRPVKPNEERCQVPAETWEDRIGYVVVQLDESSQAAQILGFVPAATDEELSLSDLRSPEELLEHLDALRSSPVERTLTNLSTWLQNTLQSGQQAIAAGWQAVEQVLTPSELSHAYAFRRNSVRRAKRIMLGDQAIALVVDMQAETAEQIAIRLQLHPVDNHPNLPPGLQMAILDDTGNVVIDATATGNEDFLELQIDGASGEVFHLQMRLNSFQDTQAFVI
ncbi:Protein of unknown function (DUF1822) [Leptolyngbyaceae cyanobacterium JSC-12]|nr:Protein of unknown function (DUF1822) [Leptolyngbyaceae cyanobacterium JSC-12]